MAVHCCPVPLAERPWLTTAVDWVLTLRGWLSGFEEGTPVKRTCSCFFSSQFLRTNMWPTGAKYKWMVPFSSATCVHYSVCSVCTVRALHRSYTLCTDMFQSVVHTVMKMNHGPVMITLYHIDNLCTSAAVSTVLSCICQLFSTEMPVCMFHVCCLRCSVSVQCHCSLWHECACECRGTSGGKSFSHRVMSVLKACVT